MNKRHHKGNVKLLSFTSKKIEKKEWKGMIQQYIETENRNVKDGCSIQLSIRNSDYVLALVSIDREH